MSISDLLTVDQERTLAWLNEILEPQLVKLNQLVAVTAAATETIVVMDKQTQMATCHSLNLLSQFMSSLVQRQQGSLTQTADTPPTPQSARNIITEKDIVNSILIKLMPIYKQLAGRTDALIIDKLFESISVILASNIASTNANDLTRESPTADCILNSLVEMFYCLNESSWRRFAYEVCRQVCCPS